MMLYKNSLQHFRKRLGLPEQYQVGRPMLQQGFANTEKIDVDLAPFKKTMGESSSPLNVINGVATMPSDVCFPTSLQYKYNSSGGQLYRKVDILNDLQWTEYMGNSILTPTTRNPIANIQYDGANYYFRIRPKSVKSLIFTYLSYPPMPVYNYDKSRGFVEYSATGSVQLGWDDLNTIDIIEYFLSDIGIVIQRQEVIAVAEKFKEKGV